jgi:hypothetical protein
MGYLYVGTLCVGYFVNKEASVARKVYYLAGQFQGHET